MDKHEIRKQTSKEEIIKSMTEMEYYPAIVEEQVIMEKYTKLPLSRVSALGTVFEPLAAAFQNIINGGEAVSGLYRVTIPKGGRLAEFRNRPGYLGSVLKENGAVGGGQAVLNPIAFDPTMLFLAVVLANIDKKLDSIKEIQQEILDFLVQKERSEIKGDLNFLSDTLNNYKYNWSNDKYKNSNHIKVLDIKQTAESKIDFYREQIESKIGKKSIIYSDREVKKRLDKMQLAFNDYQLSLYLYSFASFLEIMLLENFDSAYLEGAVKKIEDYSINYRVLYTKCYDQIETFAKSSVESHLLKGLANANKAASKVIAKAPAINKSQVDETLFGVGEKLDELGLKRMNQVMKGYIEKQQSHVRPFIENINMVSQLYNEPLELLIDKNNIYISVAEEAI